MIKVAKWRIFVFLVTLLLAVFTTVECRKLTSVLDLDTRLEQKRQQKKSLKMKTKQSA